MCGCVWIPLLHGHTCPVLGLPERVPAEHPRARHSEYTASSKNPFSLSSEEDNRPVEDVLGREGQNPPAVLSQKVVLTQHM